MASESTPEVIEQMVEHVLGCVDTWIEWDGTPAVVDGRTYTPHKAVRRIADHMIDHLAEVEARLAGRETIPDHWHASSSTTPADLAPFTDEDRDEARSRLERLAQLWALRLRSLTEAQLDARVGDAWTIREIAAHLAESDYYADAIGRLAPRA